MRDNTNPERPVGGDPDAIDVMAMAGLLWRHRFLVSVVAVAFGLAAAAYALVATPIYRAEVVVTPVAESGLDNAAASIAGRFGGLASLAGLNLGGGSAAVQEARAVLESRRLVEEYVRRNGLVEALFPGGGEQATVWHAAKRFRETVAAFATDDLAGTTTVAVEWKDPAVAAAWANGLVALANELLRTKAIGDSTRNVEYLRKQAAATDVVDMQRVIYSLIQNEMQTLMLANARADFAFTVVDPAVTPEARIRPKRKLIVASGIAFGLLAAALFVFGREAWRRHRAREAGGTGRP